MPAASLNTRAARIDLVVLDTGSVYGDWNLSQAQLADEILLVTTNELTSLQAVQRALSYLDANNIGRYKLRLIVNRYDRHTGLSKDVIGTALHIDIFHIHAERLRGHPEVLDGGQAAGARHQLRQERDRAGGSPGRKLGSAQEKQFALRSALAVFPHVSKRPKTTEPEPIV